MFRIYLYSTLKINFICNYFFSFFYKISFSRATAWYFRNRKLVINVQRSPVCCRLPNNRETANSECRRTTSIVNPSFEFYARKFSRRSISICERAWRITECPMKAYHRFCFWKRTFESYQREKKKRKKRKEKSGKRKESFCAERSPRYTINRRRNRGLSEVENPAV